MSVFTWPQHIDTIRGKMILKNEAIPGAKLRWTHGMYFKNKVQYFFSILLILCIMLTLAKNIEAKDSERYAVEKTAVNSNYEEKLNPVRLELCWLHQFQFAGYYAAVERGFYRDAGFQVTISEGRTEKIPVEELVSGRADYAVGTSSMLAHRLHGKPIVVLASIFQHSAQILLAKKESGISTPQDLIGRRVMLFGGNEDAEPKALLLKEGISLEQINIIPSSFNLNALIEGETDVFVAYSTNETFYLESQKIPVSIIDPKTYGIDFYGDCLFTSERELKERPNQVKAFREASLRGWQYAMKHPEEIIDLILTTYGTKHTREQLLFEANAIRKLMLPDLIKIGHMNPGRWHHMADTYVELGMADPGFSLEGFIYDPNPMPDYTWVRWVLGVAIAIILLISLSALILMFTNTKLKVEIDNRKQAEKALQKNERKLKELNEHLEKMIKDRTEKLKNLNEHLIKTEEKGRKAIASDLHDSVTQTIGLCISRVKNFTESSSVTGLDTISQIQEHLEQANREIRAIIYQLSPPVLNDFDIDIAIEFLVEEINDKQQADLKYINNFDKPVHLSWINKVTLYRVVSELITNVLKHSGSLGAQIELSKIKNNIQVRVEDKGSGFDINIKDKNNHSGFGLFGLSERLTNLGGEIKVNSTIGQGTKVVISVPIKK
jgi:signal transduction histidine kinase/ABC-type nitrate/sulfonate/bicarbonate transport system substrate-binding protein